VIGTWVEQLGAPVYAPWTDIASDASGQYLAACQGGGEAQPIGGSIYTNQVWVESAFLLINSDLQIARHEFMMIYIAYIT
jgi:hypothetical protein